MEKKWLCKPYPMPECKKHYDTITAWDSCTGYAKRGLGNILDHVCKYLKGHDCTHPDAIAALRLLSDSFLQPPTKEGENDL